MDHGGLDRHRPRHGSAACAAGREGCGLRALRRKARGAGAGVLTVPLDVTDPAACQAAVERIESELGPIDLAVLGAGTYAPVAIDDLDPGRFAHMMGTNYMGVVNCLAALAPA